MTDPANTTTVLLVEDEALIALAEAEQLEAEGYSVVVAGDGPAALEAVRNASPPIDLVLMDVNLGPGRPDGIQAARAILEIRDLPVVFLSAYTEQAVVARTGEVSSYGYVVKEPGGTVLSASVRTALRLYEATRAARESERHFKTLFERFPLASFSWKRADGGFVLMDTNRKADELTEGKAREFVGRTAREIHANRPDIVEYLERCFRERSTLRQETEYTVLSTGDREHLVFTYVFVEPDLVMLHSENVSARDRAEIALREALADKDVLMRELQHRIKNSLNIVTSLIGLEEKNLPEGKTREIFRATRSRIGSILTLYSQLYQSCGAGDRIDLRLYLQRLVDGLARAYLSGPEAPAIETDLDEARLDFKRAMPLGIILNELVTNALVYAFPSGKARDGGRGIVRVELSASEGSLSLRVSDNGVGLPAGERRTGTGLGLVNLLVQQLDGTLALEGGGGVAAKVTFSRA